MTYEALAITLLLLLFGVMFTSLLAFANVTLPAINVAIKSRKQVELEKQTKLMEAKYCRYCGNAFIPDKNGNCSSCGAKHE